MLFRLVRRFYYQVPSYFVSISLDYFVLPSFRSRETCYVMIMLYDVVLFYVILFDDYLYQYICYKTCYIYVISGLSWTTTKNGVLFVSRHPMPEVSHVLHPKQDGPYTGWWFQIFFIFTPIWGRFPIWLIFFKWIETTNQYNIKDGFSLFFK